MTSSLIRGKYVIAKITGPSSADVVTDGAVLQQDGLIAEVGDYQELRTRHPEVEVIGSSNHLVMPGLVNDHFHVGLTPFQLGAPDLPLEMWSLARIGTRLIDPYLDQLYGAVQMIESGTTTVQAIHTPGRGFGPGHAGFLCSFHRQSELHGRRRGRRRRGVCRPDAQRPGGTV